MDKEKLISDLKRLHKEIVSVYENIFKYKIANNDEFRDLINKEYNDGKVFDDEDKKVWNNQFFHRSAYTLLNKILFIRICEDKGFMLNDEDRVMGQEVNPNAGQKLSMLGFQKWTNLISNYSLSELIRFAFKDMNRTYNNISLYKEDKYDWLIPNKYDVELKFINPEEYEGTYFNEFELLLHNIIDTLDTSHYDFNESSDNVLGDVYERFMDRETRKALGQFYTPDKVIKYILHNTVQNADVVENPFIKVLDPSCGSGHFLIMAYDLLRREFEEKFEVLQEKYSNEEYEVVAGNNTFIIKGNQYWTKKYLHYHLLKHCIYGADIDGFALQITTINLLLKDLDNFITDELNIIECDSIVKWNRRYNLQQLENDVIFGDSLFLNYEETNEFGERITKEISINEAELLVKTCQFWANKFDYIIGNPPYLSYHGRRRNHLSLKELTRLKLEYDFVLDKKKDGKLNSVMFFLENAIRYSKENGIISYIIPVDFFETPFRDIRKYILENSEIKEIATDLVEFEDVASGQIIIKLRKAVNPANYVEIKRFASNENYTLSQSDWHDEKSEFRFNLLSNSPEKSLIQKLKKEEKLMDYYPKKLIRTSPRVEEKLKGFFSEVFVESKPCFRYAQGSYSLSEQYGDLKSRLYFLYDVELRDEYNSVYAEKAKEEGKKNPVVIGLGDLKSIKNPKIFVRQSSNEICATYTDEPFSSNQSIYVINQENSDGKSNVNLFYTLGLLNSSLITFFALNDRVIRIEKGKQPQIKLSDLKRLPFKYSEKNYEEVIRINKKILELMKYKTELEQDIGILKKSNILEQFYNVQEKIEDYESEIELLRFENDKKIFEIFNLDKNEQLLVLSNLDREKPERKEQILGGGSYIEIVNRTAEQINNELQNHTIVEVTKKLEQFKSEYTLSTLLKVKRDYRQKLLTETESRKYLYDQALLYELIFEYISNESVEIITENNKYMHIQELLENINKNIKNASEIFSILKDDNTTKKTLIVLKNIIDNFSDTWDKYRKQLEKEKGIKTFVKYDKDIYGLSKWSDEVHKKFFMDIINYHTTELKDQLEDKSFNGVIRTKKKSEKALDEINNLNIKDREDYIEVLKEKIIKAFN
ncbi:N-6 DNA methylase [Heyndrickxia sporothermodurans]|uniref:Eco57I restriction-modification methylase domain-containing protein n=1 Tax=Heyndrickxia sporothermodurans TaxID=46224 RepID=UPI003D22EC1B